MSTHPDISRMKKFMKLQHQGKFHWGRSKYKAELHRLLASPGLSEMNVETQTMKTLSLNGITVATTEIAKSPHNMTLRSWWEEEATKVGTTLYPTFEFSDDDVCEVKLVPQPIMGVLDPHLLECKIIPNPSATLPSRRVGFDNHYDFKTEWGDTVPAKAFINRDDIEEVVIPSWIKNIGYRAFYNCKNLKRVRFHPITSSQYLSGQRAMNTIHQEAFDMCLQIEECVVPPGTNVEPNAFGHCRNIKTGTVIREADFPKMWGQVVPRSAFSWRLDIVKVELPHHFTMIGDFAFQGCSNLAKCPILDNVFVGRCAFHGCSKLPSFRCWRNELADHPIKCVSGPTDVNSDEDMYD